MKILALIMFTVNAVEWTDTLFDGHGRDLGEVSFPTPRGRAGDTPKVDPVPIFHSQLLERFIHENPFDTIAEDQAEEKSRGRGCGEHIGMFDIREFPFHSECSYRVAQSFSFFHDLVDEPLEHSRNRIPPDWGNEYHRIRGAKKIKIFAHVRIVRSSGVKQSQFFGVICRIEMLGIEVNDVRRATMAVQIRDDSLQNRVVEAAGIRMAVDDHGAVGVVRVTCLVWCVHDSSLFALFVHVHELGCTVIRINRWL